MLPEPNKGKNVTALDQSKGPFNSLDSDSGQKWMSRDVQEFVEQRLPEAEVVLVYTATLGAFPSRSQASS